MLLTNQFVLLNLPKTGSTFARKVILMAYKNKYDQLGFFKKLFIKMGMAENPYSSVDFKVHTISPHAIKSQHGAYVQIPKKYQDKPVYSILRDPYEAMESRFEYGHWKKSLLLDKEVILERFPNFPNLDFKEYLHLSLMDIEKVHRVKYQIPNGIKIGPLSIQMIFMFFKDPFSVLKNLTEEYLHSDAYLKDLAPITFLDQNHLNEEIVKMLMDHGFKKDELSFILDFSKVNVTKREQDSRNALWTPENIQLFHEYEALLIRIYTHLGFHFQSKS